MPTSILIDAPDGALIDVQFLRDLGHPVMLCHGPAEGVCPLIEEGSCEMAESAHGIVFVLDLDKPEHREVLSRYRSMLRGDLPIGVVVRDKGQAAEFADLLAGLRIWDHMPAAGDLDALAAEVEAEDLT